MTASWPYALPFKFLHRTFQEQLGDNVYRFTPTEGRDITRRKKSKRTDVLSGDIPMSAEQSNILMYFYEEILADGSLYFKAPHPRTLLIHEFEFLPSIEITPLGLRRVASVQLRYDATWILPNSLGGYWDDTGFWHDEEFWIDP